MGDFRVPEGIQWTFFYKLVFGLITRIAVFSHIVDDLLPSCHSMQKKNINQRITNILQEMCWLSLLLNLNLSFYFLQTVYLFPRKNNVIQYEKKIIKKNQCKHIFWKESILLKKYIWYVAFVIKTSSCSASEKQVCDSF